MIYRENPKFIFVHIPKTGGTSVEATLARALLGKNLPELTKEDAHRYALPKSGTGFQHAKLRGYQRRYGVDLAEFFTFAFVRNPWDLVLSEIRYFQKNEGRTFNAPTLTENVRRLVNFKGSLWGHDFGPQVRYLRDLSGNMRMSYLGRFETLQKDADAIFGQLGLQPVTLPMIFNTSKGCAHYSETYDEESRDLVAKHFADDIAAFGYQF